MFTIQEPGRIIHRDYSRTEHDDFVLNVQPLLSKTTETMPIYANGVVAAWKVQFRYE